jgi:glycosyltransferase involved in cell wall biosynthesis
MKIVHLIHGLQIGGIAALVVDLCIQSNEDEIKLIAVSRDPSGEIEKRYPSCFKAGALDFKCLNKPQGKGLLKASIILRKELKEFKPEILVVHHEHLLPLVILASFGYPIIKVQVIHNQKLDMIKLHKTIGKKIYKKYVFVSEAARLNGMNQLSLPSTQTMTISNGIPLINFGPSKVKTKPSFLFVGRLTHQKNLLGLLDRYERYCELTKSPLSLTIVGKGEEEALLKEEITKRKLSKQVLLSDIQGKIADVYRAHTIFLLPSHYEGTPMVILEAMACGLVVIANDVGGISAMIDHGMDGYVYDPQDLEGFAKTMYGLSEDESLTKKISLNALKRAQSTDISITALKYHQLFSTLNEKASHEQ